jgi:hypothetical protein
MDLTMPHMDGAETFGELRRLNTDVPGAHPEGLPLLSRCNSCPYHNSQFRRYNRIWFVPILCPRGEKGT